MTAAQGDTGVACPCGGRMLYKVPGDPAAGVACPRCGKTPLDLMRRTTPPSSTRPLYREPVEARRQTALALVGRLVAVTVSPSRDADNWTVNGRLLAVASPATGAATDLAIVRRHRDASDDVAVSLATIVAIAELDR